MEPEVKMRIIDRGVITNIKPIKSDEQELTIKFSNSTEIETLVVYPGRPDLEEWKVGAKVEKRKVTNPIGRHSEEYVILSTEDDLLG